MGGKNSYGRYDASYLLAQTKTEEKGEPLGKSAGSYLQSVERRSGRWDDQGACQDLGGRATLGSLTPGGSEKNGVAKWKRKRHNC